MATTVTLNEHDMRFCFLLFVLPLAGFAQSEPAVRMGNFVVTGTRVHASDAEGPNRIRTYTPTDVEDSGAFSVGEYLDSLPPSTGGGQQLVLVDGVPTYLDLSALSPAMIAGIDVSNSGAMPEFGAYTNGRVINIRLKKDYSGNELAVEGGGSLQGGGDRFSGLVSRGAFHGKLRALYSFRYSEQDALSAEARDFSRDQDHRPKGGSDFRVPWGNPATIQAVSGNLAGLQTSVALVPEGTEEVLSSGQYRPGSGSLATGQRFFNTSPYLYLATPTKRFAGNLQFTYAVTPKTSFSLGATFGDSASKRNAPPPVTPASDATFVPAAFTPFGQDVRVGLVHTGFGPVRQVSESVSASINFGANGQFGSTWKWNSQLTGAWFDATSDTRDLDPDKFAASLASADPAARFNPFVDQSAQNEALYQTFALNRHQGTLSSTGQIRTQLNGQVAEGWGAGPLQLSLGGDSSWREVTRDYRHIRGISDGQTVDQNSRYSFNAAGEIPFLRERPLLYRLDGQITASRSGSDSGSTADRRNIGFLYAPSRPWLIRAEYSKTHVSPGEINADISPPALQTLIDPLRLPVIAENVQVVSRSNDVASSGESDSLKASLSYEAPWAKGLRLTVGYQSDSQHNAASSAFDPQDVIDNEILFPDRVTRAAPTSEDILLHQPGVILAVDTSGAAVAEHVDREMTFEVEYRTPENQLGRFSFTAGAEYLIDSSYEIAAGQPYTSSLAGPANPPDWSAHSQLQWQRGGWSAFCQFRYTGSTEDKILPEVATLDLSVGYRFKTAFVGCFGRGLQLRAGLQNLIAGNPAYADTVLGYRNGSALGSTFSASARLPL